MSLLAVDPPLSPRLPYALGLAVLLHLIAIVAVPAGSRWLEQRRIEARLAALPPPEPLPPEVIRIPLPLEGFRLQTRLGAIERQSGPARALPTAPAATRGQMAMSPSLGAAAQEAQAAYERQHPRAERQRQMIELGLARPDGASAPEGEIGLAEGGQPSAAAVPQRVPRVTVPAAVTKKPPLAAKKKSPAKAAPEPAPKAAPKPVPVPKPQPKPQPRPQARTQPKPAPPKAEPPAKKSETVAAPKPVAPPQAQAQPRVQPAPRPVPEPLPLPEPKAAEPLRPDGAARPESSPAPVQPAVATPKPVEPPPQAPSPEPAAPETAPAAAAAPVAAPGPVTDKAPPVVADAPKPIAASPAPAPAPAPAAGAPVARPTVAEPKPVPPAAAPTPEPSSAAARSSAPAEPASRAAPVEAEPIRSSPAIVKPEPPAPTVAAIPAAANPAPVAAPLPSAAPATAATADPAPAAPGSTPPRVASPAPPASEPRASSGSMAIERTPGLSADVPVQIYRDAMPDEAGGDDDGAALLPDFGAGGPGAPAPGFATAPRLASPEIAPPPPAFVDPTAPRVPAAPLPGPIATPSGSSAGAGVRVANVGEFFQQLTAQLYAMNQRVLAEAIRAGTRVTVEVRFSIDRGGRVLDARAARSTGDPLLDARAAAVIVRASPLPSLPADMPQSRLELSFPVQIYR